MTHDLVPGQLVHNTAGWSKAMTRQQGPSTLHNPIVHRLGPDDLAIVIAVVVASDPDESEAFVLTHNQLGWVIAGGTLTEVEP